MGKETIPGKTSSMLDRARALSKAISSKPGNEDIYITKMNWTADVWKTDSFSTNYVFGCGGLPKGKIIEIFGLPSSGKSTFASYLASQVQKQNGVVFWIDHEQSFDPVHQKELGVIPEDVILYTPTTAEQSLGIIKEIVTSGEITDSIIVVDSVATMAPEKVVKGEVDDINVALLARLLANNLGAIAPFAYKNRITLIFINQIREKIGVMYGDNTTTPGGNSLKFHAATRLKARKGEVFGKGNDVVGNEIILKAVKNKSGSPFREISIDLYYHRGIDYIADIFNMGVANEVISRAGASYKFGEISLGVGKEKCLAFLKDNEKILKEIQSKMETIKD